MTILTTLTERVARAIDEADNIEASGPSTPSWLSWTAEAEAAIRAVWGAMLYHPLCSVETRELIKLMEDEDSLAPPAEEHQP